MWQTGWEGSLGKNGYMYRYVWLNPFAVHLKLSQHSLLVSYTSIQSKKLKKKETKRISFCNLFIFVPKMSNLQNPFTGLKIYYLSIGNDLFLYKHWTPQNRSYWAFSWSRGGVGSQALSSYLQQPEAELPPECSSEPISCVPVPVYLITVFLSFH